MTSLGPQSVEVLPQVVNLALYRGDDFFFDMAVTDPDDGSAIDLTTRDPQAQIRRSTADTSVLADFDIDTTDAATGWLHLSLPSATTTGLPNNSMWDLQLSAPTISTIAAGAVVCSGEVTR